jgi:hypothetical protein
VAASTLWTKQVWVPGERQQDVSIPRNITAAEILFERSSLVGDQIPDAMFLDIWLSFDNGATWKYAGGAGYPDGSLTGKCGMRVVLPDPTNRNRKARVIFKTGRSMNVAVTLETF